MRIAAAIKAWTEKVFPGDPALRETYAIKFAEGIGSYISLGLGGAAAKLLAKGATKGVLAKVAPAVPMAGSAQPRAGPRRMRAQRRRASLTTWPAKQRTGASSWEPPRRFRSRGCSPSSIGWPRATWGD